MSVKTAAPRSTPRKTARQKHHRPSKANMLVFGAKVREMRLAAGLSAVEMATRMGTSQSCVSRIEGGTREPNIEVVRMLQQVVNVFPMVRHYIRTGKFA